MDAATQTLYMLSFSLIIGTIIGLFLALTLVLTGPNGILENVHIYWSLSTVVNTIRSIPFIILLVAIMPLTRIIVGTRVGTTAALFPLVVNISPYLARLFENSLLEVSDGIIEAAQSMGATTFQIIRYFLLPEAKGSLILSITTGTIGLLGSTAMAGAIGAGGVGNLTLVYGYERLNTPLMMVTVIMLVLAVQFMQSIGNYFASRVRHIKN